jgi:predicted metal-binding membrane protein
MRALLQLRTRQWRPHLPAAGLVLAAWAALAAWGMSPYADWLDHAAMEHIPAPAFVRLAVFVVGWTLMVVAMMLPGTLLLLRRCLDYDSFSLRRLAPLLLAYLATWAVFGGICYWGDGLLHELVEQAPSLGLFIAPGVLLLAGVYQLTPMKQACLAGCRFESSALSPLAQASFARIWMLGLRHGLFCLGSCWALMLLMFAAGGANLVWMLLLALIMLAERLAPRGTLLAQRVGVLMMLWWAILLFVRWRPS